MSPYDLQLAMEIFTGTAPAKDEAFPTVTVVALALLFALLAVLAVNA